jgi:hypothetical protein
MSAPSTVRFTDEAPLAVLSSLRPASSAESGLRQVRHITNRVLVHILEGDELIAFAQKEARAAA